MVSIEISDGALEDLKKIDQSVSKRIVAKIMWLQKNFDAIGIEKLHYDLRNSYKLRIGDYRVLYSANQNSIIIETVKHRREVYK